MLTDKPQPYPKPRSGPGHAYTLWYPSFTAVPADGSGCTAQLATRAVSQRRRRQHPIRRSRLHYCDGLTVMRGQAARSSIR
jgi:hypothetical protein